MTCIARCYTELTIEGLSTEQLLHVPDGMDTNILWGLGHVTFSHDRMLYEPSGLKSPLPHYFEEFFQSGTPSAAWPRTPDIDDVLSHFQNQLARTQRDLKAGVFARYAPVRIAIGVRVRSLQEALSFNATHEGFHAGVISTIREHIESTWSRLSGGSTV
jgi:hypothetical protein